MVQKFKSLLLSFAAAAGFAFAGTDQVQAQTNDTTGISNLRADFSHTQTGRDLLGMLDVVGISVVFDSTIADAGECRDAAKQIAINPRIPESERSVVLAHETRHIYQRYGLRSGEWEETAITPSQFFSLRHYQEADAFAFGAFFWAERMHELGQNPDSIRIKSLSSTFAIAKDLLQEMQGDGLTKDEYREKAFIRAFYDLNDLGYNERHYLLAGTRVPIMEQLAGEALGNPGSEFGQQMLEVTHHYMSTMPDSAKFENYLRLFGGTSQDLSEATCLQTDSVSTKNLYLYPALALGPAALDRGTLDDLKALDERFLKTRRDIMALAARKAGP